MKDLESREDIQVLVNKFYEKVGDDELLGPIFNEVAQVDWGHHLPKMYDFWESILFGTAQFKGNPMATHLRLSTQISFTEAHFERWLHLFFQTLDGHFAGPKADEAKKRAQSIAGIMKYKIQTQKLQE